MPLLLGRLSASLPWVLGYATAGYGVVAAALGAGFVWYAWKVLQHARRRPRS